MRWTRWWYTLARFRDPDFIIHHTLHYQNFLIFCSMRVNDWAVYKVERYTTAVCDWLFVLCIDRRLQSCGFLSDFSARKFSFINQAACHATVVVGMAANGRKISVTQQIPPAFPSAAREFFFISCHTRDIALKYTYKIRDF